MTHTGHGLLRIVSALTFETNSESIWLAKSLRDFALVMSLAGLA